MPTIKAKRGSTGRRSVARPAAKPAAKKTAAKKDNTPYTKKGGGYGKGGPITSVSKYYHGHTVVVQDYKKSR